MVQAMSVPLLTQFAALRDPRQATKVLHPLLELLLLLPCGMVAGADDFVELTLWGGGAPAPFCAGFCRSHVVSPATTHRAR